MARLNRLSMFLLFMLIVLSFAGCTASGPPEPPKPPISIPFAVHRAGETVSTDVRVDKEGDYFIALEYYYYGKGGPQNKDQARVRKVTGDGSRNRYTNAYANPGIPVPVELRITGTDKSGNRIDIEKKFTVAGEYFHGFQGFNGAVGGSYGRLIYGLSKPGIYRVTVKTLKDIPEMEGIPVTLSIGWRKG